MSVSLFRIFASPAIRFTSWETSDSIMRWVSSALLRSLSSKTVRKTDLLIW